MREPDVVHGRQARQHILGHTPHLAFNHGPTPWPWQPSAGHTCHTAAGVPPGALATAFRKGGQIVGGHHPDIAITCLTASAAAAAQGWAWVPGVAGQLLSSTICKSPPAQNSLTMLMVVLVFA
ncbi:hypothetical protein HaLaN_06546 [Haematococcus lacustris]|uniref:Uncharacterized protein n=1 Tax=Haematococcus lacustris TaxID=44745 RepID=A0A699YP76_HAELA|nr:hypothetical protein HaLaN_06546 [Haematococcus lacustris]